MINFSKRIKRLRTQNNMTQDDLAKKLGITKSVISAYENDMRRPSYEILIKLAHIFNVSVDYLLGVENKTHLDLSGLSIAEKNAIFNLVNAIQKGNDDSFF